MRRAVLALLLLWPALACGGQAPPSGGSAMGALLRAHDWDAADALARSMPDPLAPELVQSMRLQTRAGAGAPEIAAFLQTHPDWPLRPALSRRYDEALANERDDAVARALCLSRPPEAAAALLRCAGAGLGDAAAQAWRQAITDAPGEIAFMQRWSARITPSDQRARFARLAWAERAKPGDALARQLLRLDPADKPEASARLALKLLDPAAPQLVAALPEAARADPGLVLDLLRWQRATGHLDDAARLWAERGRAAEDAVDPAHLSRFWQARQALIRDLLQAHANQAAYDLAAMPEPSAAAGADAGFLAGWIALRRLSRPDLALEHFRALAAAAGSAVTRARAQYWLGRALAASGAPPESAYREAASWPTTYYGQLAALALGEGTTGLTARIRAATDPEWNEARALDVLGSPNGRAATLLARWGQRAEAKAFLLRMAQDAPDPAGQALIARLAGGLDLPEVAVAVARNAGRAGAMLPQIGWPEAAEPPAGAVARAVALAVIRQESSFDSAAGSPAGAQGLMQLMPGTAADIARKLHEAVAPLTDPAANMRYGTTYLAALLARFGALPPALAGYNAGPGRAQAWLAANGDPANGDVDPIDWVELIPFGETRDYVQRVIENVEIYRARGDEPAAPHPVLRWAERGS